MKFHAQFFLSIHIALILVQFLGTSTFFVLLFVKTQSIYTHIYVSKSTEQKKTKSYDWMLKEDKLMLHAWQPW